MAFAINSNIFLQTILIVLNIAKPVLSKANASLTFTAYLYSTLNA